MPNTKRSARRADRRALSVALAPMVARPVTVPTRRESVTGVTPDVTRKHRASDPRRGMPAQSTWERVAVVNSCGCAHRVHVGPCDRR